LSVFFSDKDKLLLLRNLISKMLHFGLVMKKIWLLAVLIILGCSNDREISNEFVKKGFDYSRKSGPELLRSDKNIEDSVLYFFSEAIRIDSTNKSAYWNKMAFENQYNRLENAKETSYIYYRKFNDPHGLMSLGGIYLKLSDSIKSKEFFNQALLFYNDGLETKKFTEESILFDLIFVHLANGDTTKAKGYFYSFRNTKNGEAIKDIEFDRFIRLSTTGETKGGMIVPSIKEIN
jgi:tetratricopeptide (TPR) repeat protein